MTETGLLLETLRVRTGGAIAHHVRVNGVDTAESGPDDVLDLVRELGRSAKKFEPRAVAAMASFHRALGEGIDRERALAYLLAGAVDAVTGKATAFRDQRMRHVVKSQMPGLLERFDTTTSEGLAEFDNLVRYLFPDSVNTSVRTAPEPARCSRRRISPEVTPGGTLVVMDSGQHYTLVTSLNRRSALLLTLFKRAATERSAIIARNALPIPVSHDGAIANPAYRWNLIAASRMLGAFLGDGAATAIEIARDTASEAADLTKLEGLNLALNFDDTMTKRAALVLVQPVEHTFDAFDRARNELVRQEGLGGFREDRSDTEVHLLVAARQLARAVIYQEIASKLCDGVPFEDINLRSVSLLSEYAGERGVIGPVSVGLLKNRSAIDAVTGACVSLAGKRGYEAKLETMPADHVLRGEANGLGIDAALAHDYASMDNCVSVGL